MLATKAPPLPLTLVLARVVRAWSGVPAWAPFPLGGLWLWTLPIAFPVSLGTGLLVPALAERASTHGTRASRIYALESAGAVAGGAATTALLAAGLDAAVLAVASAALALLAAAALASRRAQRAALAAAAVLAGLVAITAGDSIAAALRRVQLRAVLPGSELVAWRETATASAVLARLGGQDVLLVDGEVVAAGPDPDRTERLAGVLGALTGAPRKVLVAGIGAADAVAGLSAYAGITEVTWLVRDAALARFALEHLVPDAARVHLVEGDPVRRREALARRGPFDAIWFLVGPPLRRADDRLYTSETFGVLAGLLAPNGTMAVAVQSAENYVGPRLRLALGTVLAGLRPHCPALRLAPGEAGYVLCARQASRLTFDPTELTQRFAALEPRRPLLGEADFRSLYAPRRVEDAQALVRRLQEDPRVGPSTLERPVAVYRNLLVRAGQTDPEVAELLEGLRRRRGALAWPLLVLAAMALLRVASTRRRLDTDRAVGLGLLATTGAAGMGLDLVLLHVYEGVFGTLYVEVGLLFALYMGGLALGAGAGDRFVGRTGKRAAGLAVGALAAATALAAALAAAPDRIMPSRPVGMALFALAGALTGAVVPAAEARLRAAGWTGALAGVGIELADHLGGALAAVALGVAGIALAGLRGASWAVATTAALGAGVVVVGAWRHSRWMPARWRRWLVQRAVFRSFPFEGLTWALTAVALAAVAGHLAVRYTVLTPRVHLDAALRRAAGLVPPVEEHSEPAVYSRDANGAIAFASRATAPRVRGYGGPFNLLVATDADGRIRRVQWIEHRETPSYVEDASAFFERLVGLSLLRPIAVRPAGAPKPTAASADEQVVDAITGATVTSRAVARALEASGRRLARAAYGRPFGGGRRAPSPWRDVRWLYVLLGALGGVAVYVWGGRWVRRAWLLANAAVGGVWLGVQLSTVQVVALLRFEWWPQWSAWTDVLVALAVGLALLAGPVYCGTVCPAGAAQEALSWLGTARRLPAAVDRAARYLKYVVLAFVVVAVVGWDSDSAGQLDVLRHVWTGRPSGLAIALIVVLALGSALTVRFWCRYLCPAGAFLHLFNKVGALGRKVRPKRYRACDLGVRAPPDVDCLQCNRCLVGEATAPAHSRAHTAAFAVLLACALGLMAALATPPAPEEAPSAIAGQVRDLDMAKIRLLMASGKLSTHPALWWHPASAPEP